MLDLLEKESFDTLEKELKYAHARISILIVNAGFGKIGSYAEICREDVDNMIDLNCRAAVDTTVTCLPFMKAGDRIIEVCSTAAFSPLHEINVYASTKTFLYNYSRALRMELLPRKISVTALCPYWMKDTEFLPVAFEKAGNSRTYQSGHSSLVTPENTAAQIPDKNKNVDEPNKKNEIKEANIQSKQANNSIRNFAFAVSSTKVAKRALAASRRGAAVCTPGLVCTLHRFFGKFLPRTIFLYLWEGFRRL